jgi:hypothetical protein
VRTEAEAKRAMRLCAARVLQAIDCPCDNCLRARAACSNVMTALAWVYGLPLDLRHLLTGKTLADCVAHLADDEQVATYLSDPRMAEIIPETHP